MTGLQSRRFPSMTDPVNSPDHYRTGDVECIEAIKASMTMNEFLGYLRGNVQKYIWRYREKNGVEDLRKAEWYLRRLIQEFEFDPFTDPLA
jgi:hypothetical protein